MSDHCCSARPWLWGCLAVPLALLTVGCGSTPRGTVTGTVSYKDKPVRGGTVTFLPADGKGTVVAHIEDGKYKIEKIPAGEVTILVETDSARPKPGPPRGPEKSVRPSKDEPPQMGSALTGKGTYDWIPPKYSDPKASDLKYTVTKGDQEHDIKLVEDKANSRQPPR